MVEEATGRGKKTTGKLVKAQPQRLSKAAEASEGSETSKAIKSSKTKKSSKVAKLADEAKAEDGQKAAEAAESSKSSKPSKSSKSSTSPYHWGSTLITQSNEQSKVCARELEAIVYTPSSSVKAYLATIATKIRINIKQIMTSFAAGNLAYLRSYITDYNLIITVIDAMGIPVVVASDFYASTDPFKTVGQAQTNFIGEGFYSDPSVGYYNYQFSVMSNYGVYVSFVLSLPLSAASNVPTNFKFN